MHLTYLNDSGSHKKSPILLVGGVVFKDTWIREIEAICGVVLEKLIPEQKVNQLVIPRTQ